MSVRLANPKDADAAGVGRKPYPQRDLISACGSKVAHKRELKGDLADASRAEPGRRDLMLSWLSPSPGSNLWPSWPAGFVGFQSELSLDQIKRDHTGRDHG